MEDAEKLVKEFGIPNREEDINTILRNNKNIRDNCLFTYASMLCDKAPEDNEYIDELTKLSVQNCDAEHLDRIISDFKSYRISINDRAERRYDSNDKGLVWQKWAGSKTTFEPVPANFKKRERLMLGIFEGIIRNPNVEMQKLLRIIGSDNEILESFTDKQFEVLQKAIESGECTFTKEELLEGSQKWIGVEPEELQDKLSSKTINISEATKIALGNKGITTYETTKANNIEQSELNPEKFKEGETKDD